MWIKVYIFIILLPVTGALQIVKKNTTTAVMTFQFKSKTSQISLTHNSVRRIRTCIKRTCSSIDKNIHWNLTDTSLSFSIKQVGKNDAGFYLLNGCNSKNCTKYDIVVVDKPQVNLTVPTTTPVLQVTPNNIPQGNITVNCNVRSTSKPDNHNLTMMYRWIIDGVFTRSTSPSLDIDLTPEQREVTCRATDYPECGQVLTNLTTDVKTVKENSMCKDVLGVSSTVKIVPEYGPYQIIIRPSHSEIKKKLSEKLKVKCDVKCNPECKVMWLKDNVDVDDDDNDESILYIDKLKIDDNGEYTCNATNIHGSLKISFILNATNVRRKDDDVRENKTVVSVKTEDESISIQLILSISIGILLTIIILIITAFILYHLNKVDVRKKKRKRIKGLHYIEDESESNTFIELKHDKSLKSVRFTYQPKTNDGNDEKEEFKVVYADLDLKPSKNNLIHGNKNNRVNYTQIDFTKIPPPRPCGILDSDYQTDSD